MRISARFVSILGAWLAASGALAVLADSRSDRAIELYEQTFGAETPDSTKAREALALWEELASEDPRAVFYLSAAYARGAPGIFERDEARSLDLLMEAAEKGFPQAQFSLAWQYESGALMPRDWKKALALYEKAAGEGHVFAISRLIRVYSQGELGVLPDDAKANYWRARR